MRFLSVQFVAYIVGSLLLVTLVLLWLKNDRTTNISDVSQVGKQNALVVSTSSRTNTRERQQSKTVKADSDNVSFIKKNKKEVNHTEEVLSKEDASLVSDPMLEALNEPLLQPETSLANESAGATITHDVIDPEADMPIFNDTFNDESFLPKVGGYVEDDLASLDELMSEIAVHEKQPIVNKQVTDIENEQKNIDFNKDIEMFSSLDVPLTTSTQLFTQEKPLNNLSDLIPEDILIDDAAK